MHFEELTRVGHNFFDMGPQKLKPCGIERSRQPESIPEVSALHLITIIFPLGSGSAGTKFFQNPFSQFFYCFFTFLNVFSGMEPDPRPGPAPNVNFERGERRERRERGEQKERGEREESEEREESGEN